VASRVSSEAEERIDKVRACMKPPRNTARCAAVLG
jgi:hypothetical protein